MHVCAIPIDQLTPADQITWSELQRADTQLHNPFFRPEFVKTVGQTNSITEVALLQEAGRTVGFFPFERHANGVGRPVGGLIADVHGLISGPGIQFDAADLLRECGLSTWTFDHLPIAQTAFQPYHECVEVSLSMDLRHGFSEYCEEKRKSGSSIIQNAMRKKRQLERDFGPVRLEWHTDDPQVFAAICRWKQDQLRQWHYADVFRSPQFIDLLERISTEQSETFSGVISALYAGDQLIAAQFGVRSLEVLSIAIPAFSPEFGKYSPGMILHLELARQCPEQGVCCIELGRGENQTKSSLATSSSLLALGAVDLRPIPALLRKAWYRIRHVVYSTPLGTTPLSWYRRIRNRITPTPA